jgi:triosephosphate isomerase (TIM)
MRKCIVAANWKMNKTPAEGKLYAEDLLNIYAEGAALPVICVPFVMLESLANLFKETDIQIGAQNMHHLDSGAFTGEISAGMIKSSGANYVIIGHSERRIYFNETEEWLLNKINKALESRLIPVYCCGEPLEVRDEGSQQEFVLDQLKGSILKLDASDVSNIVIAYEPVWAIGTGRTATPQQAQDMHHYIRSTLKDTFGSEVADSIPILYGGSCNTSNARSIFSLPDVDGGLIGGASLDPQSFNELIEIANKIYG